jgi:hypothetical protein
VPANISNENDLLHSLRATNLINAYRSYGHLDVNLDPLGLVMPCGMINVILDQARYHTCNEVKGWLMLNPRIRLHYLPAYSPNLNAIEPCWKIMHEHTTNNTYHPSFKRFTEKIWDFLHHTFPRKAHTWTDRLTDNFRIMGSELTA